MTSPLSNLVTNLAEWIHKIKCKYRHDDKKSEICGNKYKDCDRFLEYTNFWDNLIEYKYLCCTSNYKKMFDENLKKRFFNTCKFSAHDIKKFIFLLRKGVHLYEYMNDQEKFNEILLSEK